MAFQNIRLSPDLSQGATFTEEDSVIVVPTAGGWEQRISLRNNPRRRYSIGYPRQSLDLMRQLKDFYERVNGQEDGFLFFDYLDNRVEGENLEPILDSPTDTATDRWRIVKRVGNRVRNILKPIETADEDIGALPVEGLPAGATLDYGTGIVTLASPLPRGASIPISCSFDVPVRFDGPTFDIDVYVSAEAPDIELLELLGANAT